MNEHFPAAQRAEGGLQSGLSPPGQGFTALLELGRAHFSQGECDLAVADFTQALQIEPADAEVFLLRGQACQKQGEYEQAIADHSAAIQLLINQTLQLAQRILALTARREFDSAVADGEQSHHINQRLARAYASRGELYLQQGDWARAVADFTQVLQLEPSNALAYLRCGEANARLGEWSKATRDFSEAIRLAPSPAAYNLRGEVRQRQGQHDLALADFTEALRLDPHYTTARNNRGDVLLRRGSYDEAIADYSQAIHTAPRCVRSFLCRSVARTEKGDYERALGDFAKAISIEPRNPFADEHPEAAHRLRTAHERACAEMQRFKRDFRKAAGDFASATYLDVPLGELFPAGDPPAQEPAHTEASPLPSPPASARPSHNGTPPRVVSRIEAKEPPPSPEQRKSAVIADRNKAQETHHPHAARAEQHYQRGLNFHQLTDHERALEEYTAALTCDPGHLGAYLARGQVYRLLGQPDEAIADFTAVIQRDPAQTEAWLRRAITWTEQEQYERAFHDYRSALQLDAGLAPAYMNRGLAYIKVGEFASAVEDADRALLIDPGLARAYFVRGVARGKQNRPDLAVADFNRLLSLEPDNVPALNQRGLLHASLGNYQDAVADCTEAMRLAPEFDAALFNRGSAYRLLGMYDKSIADFTEFIRRRPRNAHAYHHRGLARLAKEEYDLAIADFTHAYQLDPNLNKAYTSCLEATRTKYEKRLARPSPPPLEESPPASSHRHREGEAPAEPDSLPPLRIAEEKSPPKVKKEASLARHMNETQAEHTEPTAPQPNETVGKLPVECPECGTAGLVDVRNLDKMFRCPGCSTWWRTSAGGQLVQAAGPALEVEGVSSTSRSKHHVPATVTDPNAATPKGTAAAPKPAKAGKTRPQPVRPRQEEGRLRTAGLWLATAGGTRAGRWLMAASVLAGLLLIPMVFPSLFPSALKSRSQKVAHAWLAKDAEQIKQFADPRYVEQVPRWLEDVPPPDLEGQNPKVSVAVQRNDGRTADVVIQIKATDKAGKPAYYVFRHRWIARDGVWYVRPVVNQGAVAVGGK